ncbi:MAG: CapA family protein [Caldilineaceae bacterium]|nr:CapA family protein [Caldilineaceae bacterium]
MNRLYYPTWLLSLILALSACTAILPQSTPAPPRPEDAPVPPMAYFATAEPTLRPSPTPPVTPTPIPLDGPVTVAVSPGVAARYAAPVRAILDQATEIQALNGPQPMRVVDDPVQANTVITMGPPREARYPLLTRTFAPVVPFATVIDAVTLDEINARWTGGGSGALIITPEAAAFLPAVLGDRAVAVPVVSPGEMLRRLEETPGSLGLLPFDQLDPTFKVLTVDGRNVLDNRLDLNAYPLATALHVEGEAAPLVVQYLRPIVSSLSPVIDNRDPYQMTTLIMTGVTAMSRATAAVMEREGYIYPALVISDTLAAADITHVSNEVPFLDDCVVNNTLNNLRLCSHTDYWAALEAIGTDIVGLSGNHVNDFGYDGAQRSISWYREHEIPIYGSGLDVTEACTPLRWEHNGNTFAFVAVLAFGPSTAWATDDLPGACYYYDHTEEILALVEELAGEADIVAVELQYLETYNPWPTDQQVLEFRELRAAGADIVTGVQSHVPQASEPYGAQDKGGPGMINYGLGNLFFDQMWSWETRTELFMRHTIYRGRLINTEILTAVLEDYAQPRWATQEERSALLETLFNAAPTR